MTVNIAAYKDVLAKPGREIENLRQNIRADRVDLQKMFSLAVAGYSVLSPELIADLSGTPGDVVFNNFPADELPDYKPFLEPIAKLEALVFKDIPLSSQEEKELDEAYNALAAQTGYSKKVLKFMPTDALQEDEKNATLEDASTIIGLHMNAVILDHKQRTGTVVVMSDKDLYLILSRFKTQDAFLQVGPVGDQNDPPSKAPPFSKEIWEFMQAMHESEHAASHAEKKVPVVGDKNLNFLAEEIDADMAMLNFLKENNMDEGIEYLLQIRMNNSFKIGFRQIFEHDTASFLRIYEHSGQQLDLEKFVNEKKDLMNRIADEMFLPEDRNVRSKIFKTMEEKGVVPKTIDLMDAVDQILGKDDFHRARRDAGKTYDPKQILTDMQRAEAKSFMEDSAALGYMKSADYELAPAAPASAAPRGPGM